MKFPPQRPRLFLLLILGFWSKTIPMALILTGWVLGVIL